MQMRTQLTSCREYNAQLNEICAQQIPMMTAQAELIRTTYSHPATHVGIHDQAVPFPTHQATLANNVIQTEQHATIREELNVCLDRIPMRR